MKMKIRKENNKKLSPLLIILTLETYLVYLKIYEILFKGTENQAYYIQSLLANKLDKCKGKGNAYANGYIKEIQNTYKKEELEIKQPMIVDKRKQ